MNDPLRADLMCVPSLLRCPSSEVGDDADADTVYGAVIAALGG